MFELRQKIWRKENSQCLPKPKNALKEFSPSYAFKCRLLPTLRFALKMYVALQIFTFTDKEMFYLKNAKHDTSALKRFFWHTAEAGG